MGSSPHWIVLDRGAAAADELLARFAPELVSKAPDPLTSKGLLTIVRALARELITETRSTEAAALADAFDAIDVNWPMLSADKRERAIAEAERIIANAAQSIAPTVTDVLQARGGEIVRSTKGAMIGHYDLPIAARMTQLDQRIVDHAATSQAHYVTNQYGQIATSAGKQMRTIVGAGLRDGLGRNDIGGDLYDALGKQLGRSEAYFINVASIVGARGRTWAQLSSLDEAEIEEWMFSAVLDEVTCFAAGTRVLMANGRYKNIENIFGGELVMSCKGRPRRVARQIEKTGRKWFTFYVVGAKAPITVTHSHGILTSKGWMRASSLTKGDEVALYRAEGTGASAGIWSDTERGWMARPGKFDGRTLNDIEPWPSPYLHRLGMFGRIRRIIEGDLSRRVAAYDLEVEDDYGYVAEGVIVHNSPICRLLDGKKFSTRQALDRYKQVAAAERPEAVKDLQPFVQEGKDDNGQAILYYLDGEKRVTVAQVEDNGVGRKDDRGKFKNVSTAEAMQAAGIGPPPLHGHCRSLIVPG